MFTAAATHCGRSRVPRARPVSESCGCLTTATGVLHDLLFLRELCWRLCHFVFESLEECARFGRNTSTLSRRVLRQLCAGRFRRLHLFVRLQSSPLERFTLGQLGNDDLVRQIPRRRVTGQSRPRQQAHFLHLLHHFLQVRCLQRIEG